MKPRLGSRKGDQQETGNQQICGIISGIAIEEDHMYNVIVCDRGLWPQPGQSGTASLGRRGWRYALSVEKSGGSRPRVFMRVDGWTDG